MSSIDVRRLARVRIKQRRYGSQHQRARRSWEPLVLSGLARCARCDGPIAPSEPWDLGHDDLSGGYSGPEHRACNRGAPMRNSVSRVW
jgi:hypothetical protein